MGIIFTKTVPSGKYFSYLILYFKYILFVYYSYSVNGMVPIKY